MFERLKYLYETNKLNVEQLGVAVSKGWITTEQKEQIVNPVPAT
jgi:hypothetical protein